MTPFQVILHDRNYASLRTLSQSGKTIVCSSVDMERLLEIMAGFNQAMPREKLLHKGLDQMLNDGRVMVTDAVSAGVGSAKAPSLDVVSSVAVVSLPPRVLEGAAVDVAVAKAAGGRVVAAAPSAGPSKPGGSDAVGFPEFFDAAGQELGCHVARMRVIKLMASGFDVYGKSFGTGESFLLRAIRAGLTNLPLVLIKTGALRKIDQKELSDIVRACRGNLKIRTALKSEGITGIKLPKHEMAAGGWSEAQLVFAKAPPRGRSKVDLSKAAGTDAVPG